MKYTLVNHPAVSNDLVNALDYYKDINTILARQFLYRLREANKHILLNPLGFQIKYNNVRTVILKQFPFLVHYILNDTNQQIIIIAITHAYKNPADYTQR